MKQNLLLFLLLMSAYLLQAQNVLVKDSLIFYDSDTISSSNVTTRIYNSNCLVDTIKSPGSITVYYYYPNKTLYQSVSQNLDENSGQFINNFKATYQYNSSGNTTYRLYELWDITKNSFVNFERDSLFWDQDNKLTRSTNQYWDIASNTWMPSSEANWFYNDKGQIDYYISESLRYNSVNKVYYSYFGEGSKNFQVKSYNYYNNNLLTVSLNTHYIDSANYIRTDSTVSGILNTDSVLENVSSYISIIYYNTDNTIKETINYTIDVNGSQINFFKDFSFYAPCPVVLPVTLLMLTGERQNNNALLHWQTASETNTLEFGLQRSIDGEHFTTIGSVAASGNSSANKNYTYTDANAFLTNAPKLYYRLAESDKEEAIHYSKTVTLTVTAGKLLVYVSPNPVLGNINLYTTATINHAIITIIDMKGKVLYAAPQNLVTGNKVSINASTFAKGMYIVTIQSALVKQQLKIIKE